MPVMHPGRVDVIGAGALVLRVLMDEFGAGRGRRQRARHPRRDRPAARPRPEPRWPCDADGFPVTRTPAGVARAAAGVRDLAVLDARVSGCRACPRLVAWREEVARVKRASFRDWDYWGRPVPGLGPADARIAVVGLAPGGARRQPDRPRVHRRPQRRLDLRRAVAGRAGQPADLDAHRRRARAHRRPGRRRGALRAAGQRARPRRSATPARRGWPASWPCSRGCG